MKIWKKAKGLLGISVLLGSVFTIPTSPPATASDEQSSAEITVDKDKFPDYLVLGEPEKGKEKARYNKTTGIVTLTPRKQDQAGNFTLKNKISLSHSFELKGSIYLGDRL